MVAISFDIARSGSSLALGSASRDCTSPPRSGVETLDLGGRIIALLAERAGFRCDPFQVNPKDVDFTLLAFQRAALGFEFSLEGIPLFLGFSLPVSSAGKLAVQLL
ncbi:MAG: hypothetical protein R3A46_07245 [Thermomicrobiales bacterium]